MRKRLIGKAFAIAMSGAMVLTATPVTANIFHVAHLALLKRPDSSRRFTGRLAEELSARETELVGISSSNCGVCL